MAEIVIDIVGKDNFSSTLGNFGNIITGIKSAVDLIGDAFNAAVNVITPFINSAVDSEKAIANLEATMRSMGDVTGMTSEQFQEIANTMQNSTMFSDEQILNAEAMLLTFGNITGDIFPQAIALTADLGSKFGNLDTAAVMLGKALNDPIGGVTALRRVGVQLTEQQEEAIKKFVEQGDIMSAQQIIMGELERQVGGLAVAYGETFAGKLEIFKNRIDEIRETIGGAFLPVLSLLLDKTMEFIENSAPLQGFLDFLGLFNEYAGNGVPILQALGMAFANIGSSSDWVSNLNPHLREFASVFLGMQAELDQGGTIFDAIAVGLERLSEMAVGTPFEDVIVTLQNFLQTAETEGWGEAFQGLFEDIGTALSTAFEQADFSGASDTLTGVIEGVNWASVGETIANSLSGVIETVLGGLYLIVDRVNWGPLGSAVGNAIWEAIKGFFNGMATTDNTWVDILIGVAIPPYLFLRFREEFAELGGDMWAGLADGWEELNVDFGEWWFDHLVEPVRRALGISSPSTVFMDIGRNIVLGLIAGLGSMAGILVNFVSSIVDIILAPLQPVLDLLGIGGDTLGTAGTVNSSSGLGSGTTSTGATGTVVNQYFSGATINVGSWDQIAYDCISPNPFVASTSGQLGTSSGGGGTGGPR